MSTIALEPKHVVVIAKFIVANTPRNFQGYVQKIEMIKTLRNMVPLSLKGAKDMIEACLPIDVDPLLKVAQEAITHTCGYQTY